MVYTTIRTIGNPLDMVAGRESGVIAMRKSHPALSVSGLTAPSLPSLSNLLLHVLQDVLSFV